MSIEYTKGNAISIAINSFNVGFAHGCNCHCKMGKGIAREVRNRLPQMYSADKSSVIGDRNKLVVVILNSLLVDSLDIINDDDHDDNHHDLGFQHNCIHDNINGNEKIISKHRSLQTDASVTTHPIRLIFNTTYLDLKHRESQTCYHKGQVVTLNSVTNHTCKKHDILTPELADLLTKVVLPHISSTFAKYLSVRGTKRNSYHQPFTCYEDYSMDITDGFEGDYIIYVSAHPIAARHTIAYSRSCLTHADNGAPYVGIFNFAPSFFTPFTNETYRQSNQALWNKFLRVGLHETTHALGFSATLYSKFQDRTTGKPYSHKINPSINSSLTTPSGVNFQYNRYFLTTPSVISVTRNHFGCKNLIGAELENIGVSATSHWKTTRFGEELMLAHAKHVSPLTNLTLALLYDTGWYELNNIGNVESTSWGKGMGCDFADKPCTPEIWSREGYWSSVNNKTGCSASRSGIGKAGWVTYKKSLPDASQHFTNPRVGGTSAIYDNCVWNKPDEYCFDTSRHSKYEDEIMGANSFCFKQLLSPQTHRSGSGGDDQYGYGCRPQRCRGLQLQVQFKGVWFDCPAAQTLLLSPETIIVCPNDNTCSPTAIPLI
ncbi:hypothetical protein PPL_08441 [Heterostelium album PN500]|uniref:Uncharacterized protein n=1 Tax=Heterostelium pallidum (strain ATCC 26659 / Pp 5 / PN500) TaxID=670386 RepID=D3BI73_HETP5|nr:hypothetical protein PPL_08441 [Heterostelium album PN500]EFA78973.1 hypothetical protein PPL_08441 [Heterostelium album PN500]|eukprot:XP_020431097.1 hypothetical protein PPL_08441 [Heterostelium album PN500]